MSQTTIGQEIGLLVMKEISALLSIAGSSLLILCILRQRSKRPIANHTLHQLLLGLSISDWVSSLVVLTASFMVPEGALQDLPWFVGNEATCTTSAFFQVWSVLSATTYNGFLALHFWRSVSITQKSSHYQRRNQIFRWLAHIWSISVGGVVAIAALIGEFFRPHLFLGHCYYSVAGSHTAKIIGWVRLFYRWGVTIIAILCTIALAWKVLSNFQRSSRYSTRWGDPSNEPSCSPNEQPSSQQRRASFARMSSSARTSLHANNKKREVFYQSCWYLLAYLNTFAPPFVVWICLNVNMDVPISKRRGDPAVYALLLFWWVATPLQGFLNFAAFIRPRYYAWKAYLERQEVLNTASAGPEDPEGDMAFYRNRPTLFNLFYLAVMEDMPSSQTSHQQQLMRLSRNGMVPESSANSSSEAKLNGKEMAPGVNLLLLKKQLGTGLPVDRESAAVLRPLVKVEDGCELADDEQVPMDYQT